MLLTEEMENMYTDKRWFEEMLSGTKVVVVVPAYRVADHITHVIENIPSFIRHIVVVDDCSPDDVAVRMRPYLSDCVRYVRHPVNQGVGGAMLTGYAMALKLDADIVVKMDGDDQMDAAYLPMLLLPILQHEADYTKGNRFIHTYALQQMPFLRRVGNFGLTFLTKLSSGYWNIFDPTNGYTAIHSKVLRLINTDAISRRYFYETSMLFDLRRIQAVVKDVPMPARYGDEISSLSLKRTLFRFPSKLIRGLIGRLGRQYFLYDFTAVSLLLVLSIPLLLFGFIWGGLNWYISFAQDKIATTGTVLLAVLPIIIGIQFLVQALVLDIGSVPTQALHSHIIDADEILTHTASLSTYLNLLEEDTFETKIMGLG